MIEIQFLKLIFKSIAWFRVATSRHQLGLSQ